MKSRKIMRKFYQELLGVKADHRLCLSLYELLLLKKEKVQQSK
jgi:hypothetical protein